MESQKKMTAARRISIGSVELHAVVQGSGSGLLLVHGFPLDHTMWQAQIDDLSRDFQVIAVDLRGFGRSDVTEGTVTMQQMAADLAALLRRLGIERPVTFCGLSMGGYIAWQFWQHHRPLLAQLVLCDTRAIGDARDVAELRLATAERVITEGAALLAQTMLDKLFAPGTRLERPELVEAARRVICSTQPVGIAAALRGMAQHPDFTGQLSSIDVPTLVLCGADDEISPVAEMRQIAASIPQSQFVEVAGAGHMSPLESPGAVNEAIRNFLRR